jgi:hypothetical protein
MIVIKSKKNNRLETSLTEKSVFIKILGKTTEDYIELDFHLGFETDRSEYVFLPACCYDGNKIKSEKIKYRENNYPRDCPVFTESIMRDVPRINLDGSGQIQVTTGDVSVPCVGIFSKKEKRAFFVFTVQEIEGINLGLAYTEGKIMVRYPYFREGMAYRWPLMTPSLDKGKNFNEGNEITIPYKIIDCPCLSIEEFYSIFFANRKCMGLNAESPTVISFEKQKEIHLKKFNSQNWYEEPGFYGVVCKGDSGMAWQPSWVGGVNTAYALLKLGTELEQQRVFRTLDYLFASQTPAGFFEEAGDDNGNFIKLKNMDGSPNEWHLVRKSADVLYFMVKIIDLLRQRNISVPQKYMVGTKKVAEAFVKVWNENGQFGQYVDHLTGKLDLAYSASGSLIPAGLCLAYRMFGEDKYLETAIESGHYYYDNFAAKGMTNGGPGDILQAIDSESCAAMLESFISLYYATNDNQWIHKGKHTANLLSSWIVAYNYKFPHNSEFNRLDMKTLGTCFANIQNKHSAPGLCTLSGEGIYKIYKLTGDKRYRDLFYEQAMTISQYMSTEKRPIWSWDVPKDASLLNDDTNRVPKQKLPPGYICERVNMSDWESLRCIGGVFKGSCWSETSNMLVIADCSNLFDENIPIF